MVFYFSDKKINHTTKVSQFFEKIILKMYIRGGWGVRKKNYWLNCKYVLCSNVNL